MRQKVCGSFPGSFVILAALTRHHSVFQLKANVQKCTFLAARSRCSLCAIQDLNLGPHRYQRCALNQAELIAPNAQ